MADTIGQQSSTVAQIDVDVAMELCAQWDTMSIDHVAQFLARHRLASVPSASAEGIKASAEVSLMYLQTGFIECPQCGEEVPTKELDAAYELATVVQPAPTIGGTVRSEPVSATNQAEEVERKPSFTLPDRNCAFCGPGWSSAHKHGCPRAMEDYTGGRADD